MKRKAEESLETWLPKSLECLNDILFDTLPKESILCIDEYWTERFLIVGGNGNGQMESQIGLLDYDYAYQPIETLKLAEQRWNAHLGWDEKGQVTVFGGRNDSDQTILGSKCKIHLLPTEIIDLKRQTIQTAVEKDDNVLVRLKNIENLERPLVSTSFIEKTSFEKTSFEKTIASDGDNRIIIEQSRIFIFDSNNLTTWTVPNKSQIHTRSGCVANQGFLFFVTIHPYMLWALNLATLKAIGVTEFAHRNHVSLWIEPHRFDNIIFDKKSKQHDNGNQPVVVMCTTAPNPQITFIYYSARTNTFLTKEYNVKIQPILGRWNEGLLARNVFFKSGKEVWFSDIARPSDEFGADWFLYSTELPLVLDFNQHPHQGPIYADKNDLKESSTLVACPYPMKQIGHYQTFPKTDLFCRLHPVLQMAWFHGTSPGLIPFLSLASKSSSLFFANL